MTAFFLPRFLAFLTFIFLFFIQQCVYYIRKSVTPFLNKSNHLNNLKLYIWLTEVQMKLPVVALHICECASTAHDFFNKIQKNSEKYRSIVRFMEFCKLFLSLGRKKCEFERAIMYGLRMAIFLPTKRN